MSSNLNQVTMSGNATRNGELRYSPSGQPVLTINLATNRQWKDENGEKHEKVVYTRWAVWGKRAESLTPYILKGTGLILTGRLEAPSAYANKEGQPAASNQLTVDELYFVGGKKANGNEATAESTEAEPQSEVPADEIPF